MRKLQGSWLKHYLDYTSEDETHKHFRYWCGVSVLSAVLKNKAFFKRGKITVYPNQYIVLVGPPGSGKGAAINPAVDLAKLTDIPHYLADRLTPQGILDTLEKGFPTFVPTGGGGFMPSHEACATIVSTELSTLLSSSSDYIFSFLCDAWDKNTYEETIRTKKAIRIKNMCVGLLGGCTPEYIRRMNKDSTVSITGGYTSRNIYAFANERAKTNPWPKDIDKKLQDTLVEDLKYISGLRGEMYFTPEALARWDKWFVQYYDHGNFNEFDSDVLVNFKNRVWSHAIKLAMCLSLAENDSMRISEAHLIEALDEVASVTATLDVTFRGVGESNLAENQDRIFRFIEKKKSTSFSEILKYNLKHITAEDLERVLNILTLAGMIQESSVANKLMYQIIPQSQRGVYP